MATTLDTVERRLAALEQEMLALRQLLHGRLSGETPAECGARLLREAKASQAAISAGAVKAFAEVGIAERAADGQNLEALMAASGIRPEDNLFSREILAMREE